MSESENRRPRSSRSQPSREGARREDRETGGYRRDDRGESRGEGRGGPRGGDRRGGGGLGFEALEVFHVKHSPFDSLRSLREPQKAPRAQGRRRAGRQLGRMTV